MKITSFSPVIATKQVEETVKLFEELGFRQTHNPFGTGMHDSGTMSVFESNRMTNPDGFHVDVASSNMLNQDVTLIRMNVDNYDEALALLTAHGFQIAGSRVDQEHSKAVTVAAPSGFRISVVEHKK